MPTLRTPGADATPDAPPELPLEWRAISRRERRLRPWDLMVIVAWSALSFTAMNWIVQSKTPSAPKGLLLGIAILTPIMFAVAWFVSGLPLPERLRWLEIPLGVLFVSVAFVVLALLVVLILVDPAAGILTTVSSVALLVYLISWS